MEKIEKAVELFQQNYLCSQSVFGAYCEDYGVSVELGFKLSKFLGAGYLFRGDYCGAISGALLIYGLKYSSGIIYDEVADEIFYQVAKEHIKRFEKLNGSCMCKKLLAADLSTDEGMTYIRENNLFDVKCPKYVKDSAQILEQLINEIEQKKLINY